MLVTSTCFDERYVEAIVKAGTQSKRFVRL